MSNGFDGEKQFPFPLIKEGKGYSKALKSRSTAILETLMGFLASNYKSSIPSNEFSTHLKAMSVEMAKFTLALEELSTDISFELVRSEFLNQAIGHFIFLEDQPDLDLDDEDFREFLLTIIEIFFQGSTPKSIRDAVELFTDQDFEIKELFKESRKENSVYNISDQFSFTIEFDLDNQFPEDPFVLQHNFKLLINLVKPAHTLYKIAHVFGDVFDRDKLKDVREDGWLDLHDRRYDDVRKYCKGMKGFTSSSGYTELNNLKVLQDEWERAPLASVREGASLVIPQGVNKGRYLVKGYDKDLEGVILSPRLQKPEEDISYKVEVDRLGNKKEIHIQGEDASDQFVSSNRLEVIIDGPTTMVEGSTEEFEASISNSDALEFTWDLVGNGQFEDASGAVIDYTAPSGITYFEIAVLVTTVDGREAKAYHLIEIMEA